MENGALDNMEGDIMTFSELDLAQLGLSSSTSEPPCFSLQPSQLAPGPTIPAPFTYPDPLSLFQPTPLLPLADLRHASQESPQLPGLPRRRSRYLRQQGMPQSNPIMIPASTGSAEGGLNPMQRWQDSPPETEAASLSAIVGALRKMPLRNQSSAGSLRSQRVGSRAASTVSFGSGTSISSGSVCSMQSTGRNARRNEVGRTAVSGRVQKGRGKNGNGPDKSQKVFPCTFCCDHFKTKYDWGRHEKSLHLNLGGWVCTPFGGTIVSSDTGRSHCAYCNKLDPTPDHLAAHNHEMCHGKGNQQVFSRKDHLVQHLRLVHLVDTQPLIAKWKVEPPPVRSRCGFCNIYMSTWQERADHLAMHFRKGAKMDDWKGDHCFEPSIAARVANAIPPYLIGPESRAIVPFSATDPETQDQLSQIRQSTVRRVDQWQNTVGASTAESEILFESPEFEPPDVSNQEPNLTYPEVLALHLGRYAREQMRIGHVPTDEMFQSEARRIIFDTQDSWEQTIADNEDWLADFRRRHLQSGDATMPHLSHNDAARW